MRAATILIVDDEPNALEGLARTLWRQGYKLITAASPEAGLERLREQAVDVVISDHLMPGLTGLEFLKLVRDRYPDTVRIMLTGHGDLRTAVRAINEGEIYRFLSKPCPPEELQVTVHLALEQLELQRENRRLQAIIRSNPDLAEQLEQAAAPPPRG